MTGHRSEARVEWQTLGSLQTPLSRRRANGMIMDAPGDKALRAQSDQAESLGRKKLRGETQSLDHDPIGHRIRIMV